METRSQVGRRISAFRVVIGLEGRRQLRDPMVSLSFLASVLFAAAFLPATKSFVVHGQEVARVHHESVTQSLPLKTALATSAATIPPAPPAYGSRWGHSR